MSEEYDRQWLETKRLAQEAILAVTDAYLQSNPSKEPQLAPEIVMELLHENRTYNLSPDDYVRSLKVGALIRTMDNREGMQFRSQIVEEVKKKSAMNEGDIRQAVGQALSISYEAYNDYHSHRLATNAADGTTPRKNGLSIH